jgi:hypothetical protein
LVARVDTLFLILLALADGDAHGYRLRQAVIERSDGQIRLTPARCIA